MAREREDEAEGCADTQKAASPASDGFTGRNGYRGRPSISHHCNRPTTDKRYLRYRDFCAKKAISPGARDREGKRGAKALGIV